MVIYSRFTENIVKSKFIQQNINITKQHYLKAIYAVVFLLSTARTDQNTSNDGCGYLLMWFWTLGETLHPNVAHIFLLLDAVTNEKTLKCMQLDNYQHYMSPHPAPASSSNCG